MVEQFDHMTSQIDVSNAVVARGYDILDEWNRRHLSSKAIVGRVKRAIAEKERRKTVKSRMEALSCLFALDQRIRERYRTILRTLIYYFSYKRETEALNQLRFTMKIAETQKILDAIELEAERICKGEFIEEEDDDTTHGGKANGAQIEENGAERQTDGEGLSSEEQEKDEASETREGEEEGLEDEQGQKEDGAEEKQEEKGKDPDASKQNENEPSKTEEKTEGEPSDKEKEADPQKNEKENKDSADSAEEEIETEKKETIDYRIDSELPPPTETQKKTDKLSFIDEVILDNMVKGKKDPVAHNPLEDVRSSKDSGGNADRGAEAEQKGAENARNRDDLRNGDRFPIEQGRGGNDKGTGTERNEPKQGQEQKTEQKPVVEEKKGNEIKIERAPKEAKFEVPKTIVETNERVPVTVDISVDDENAMRGAINESMTEQQVIAFKEAMERIMQEQMDAQLGDVENKTRIVVNEAIDGPAAELSDKSDGFGRAIDAKEVKR